MLAGILPLIRPTCALQYFSPLVTKGTIYALLLLQDTMIEVLPISVVITPSSSVVYCLPISFNTLCLLLFYIE